MKPSHALLALSLVLASVPADAQTRPPSASSWIPGLPVPVFFPAGFPAIPGLPTAGGTPVPTTPGTTVPTTPGTTTVPTTPGTTGTTAPPTPGSFDATGSLVPAYEAQEAAEILRQLVASLAADKKAKVDGIPLAVDNTSGEVNAFAGCEKGSAYMAITAPLMKAVGHIAEAKAADELFGSKRVDAYTRLAADSLGAGKPVPSPPAGFYTPAEALDPRKLARQRDVFDEEVAFVLGHELGHHYLGHTGCANGGTSGGIDPTIIGRIASNVLPGFNQPNEIAADVAGTQNLLDAGAARAPTGQAAWNEEGALLVLGFFGTMQQLSPSVVALGFLRTHPPPQLRTPIVQDTANRWRQSHGAGGKTTSGFPFPLPFPIPGL
jgi:hypothetical protein